MCCQRNALSLRLTCKPVNDRLGIFFFSHFWFSHFVPIDLPFHLLISMKGKTAIFFFSSVVYFSFSAFLSNMVFERGCFCFPPTTIFMDAYFPSGLLRRGGGRGGGGSPLWAHINCLKCYQKVLFSPQQKTFLAQSNA